MRVAVTGARGYLGRALVPALAADERVEQVIAIDARANLAPAPPKVSAVTRDVRDPALATDLAGADALVHLAFRVLGGGADAESVNVGGSRAAFEAAIRAGARTIVHASSAAAYGSAPDNPVGLSEEHPLRPLPAFYYPETKVAVEKILDELEAREQHVRVVRMRPVSTLGPGAPELAGGRIFLSLSDFDPPMQFTWIDDVIEAFRTALLDREAHGAFNVGAPGPVPASKVAGLLGARRVRLPHRVLRALAAGGGALRLPGAMDPAWVDMLRYPIVVDTARAERELGWRASGNCESALRRHAAVKLSTGKQRGRRMPPATLTRSMPDRESVVKEAP